jgi:hypothetical protein
MIQSVIRWSVRLVRAYDHYESTTVIDRTSVIGIRHVGEFTELVNKWTCELPLPFSPSRENRPIGVGVLYEGFARSKIRGTNVH